MNRFAAGIRVALITIGLCVSASAFAETQCVGGAPPPCEPIPVTDSRDATPPTCQDVGMCDNLQALNDMLAYLASTAATPQTAREKVIGLLKAGHCKKASDDCVTWGQRMTTPKGLPTPNAQSTGTGFCQAASVGILGVAIAICTNIVNLEVSAEGCYNVSCPQI